MVSQEDGYQDLCCMKATRHCWHERGFTNLGASVPHYRTLCCWCGVEHRKDHGPFITGIKLEPTVKVVADDATCLVCGDKFHRMTGVLNHGKVAQPGTGWCARHMGDVITAHGTGA